MKTYIDNVLEEFDEYGLEIFFEILGDITYLVDVLDNNGIHREVLQKRELHKELRNAYKDWFKQKLQEALDQQKQDLIRKLEGEKKEQFIEVTDNDGHRYQIPHSKRDEWIKWCEIGEADSEDPRYWEVPEYAERIDGMPITDTRLFNQALDRAIEIIKEEE